MVMTSEFVTSVTQTASLRKKYCYVITAAERDLVLEHGEYFAALQ
jgi:hypothetical protein